MIWTRRPNTKDVMSLRRQPVLAGGAWRQGLELDLPFLHLSGAF